MILNFYLFFFVSIFLSFILIVSNLFLAKINESAIFLNMITKIILDDFYFSIFYYIWGNFYYMVIFFIIFFIPIFTTKSNLFFKKSLMTLILVVYIFMWEYFDYFYLNFYLFDNHLLLENYNMLLNNSVNKIHPFILYMSLTFLVFSSFTTVTSMNIIHVNTISTIKTFSFVETFLLLYSTLFLGGWWAFQEGSWGGWWDWDVSEMFGLCISYMFLKTIHTKKSFYNINYFIISVRRVVYILFIFYFFMQLNFNLISHNFNLHISRNFMITFIYFSLLVGLVFILCMTSLKLSYTNQNYLYTLKIKLKDTNHRLFFYYIICSITFILLLSTFTILSNWIWNNYNLVLLLISTNFADLLLLLVISLLSIYFRMDIWLISLILLFVINKSTYAWVVLLCSNIFTLNQFTMHFLIFLIVMFSCVVRTLESSVWNFLDFGFNQNYYNLYGIFKVSYPFIDISKNMLSFYTKKTQDFSWYYDFSVVDFKLFSLYQKTMINFQTFLHDSYFFLFSTALSSRIEMSIILFVTTILLIIKIFSSWKQIIIF